MYNLLIVDDEPLAVRGVKSAVNWDELGISDVFTAYNAEQAKNVFGSHFIDIMLCDIEMPEDSGLDLLSWVREHYPKTETIFLTCHADFSFARQAIQLGSLDYLLKPLPPEDLENVMNKAIEKIRKERELAQYGQSWVQHHPLFIERFWLDIVNLVIPANLSAIQKAMEERKISYPIEMSVLPILIHVQRWHKSLTLRDEKILEYGLKQAAAETLQNLQLDVQMLSLDRNELLAVLMIPNDYSLNINEIKNNLRTYVSSCYPYFYCDLACYVGDRVLMERLPEMVRQLLTMQKNNVAYYNEVFLRGEQPRISTPAAMPDMKLWLVMLVKGAYEQVILEVQQFMNKTVQHSEIDVSFMHQFHHDFMQIVYFVLREKGIQAHKLFQDSRSIELSAGAGRSVVDMLNWIHHIVMKTMDYIQDVEQSHSVADKVRTFITKHFDQDLSREQIANQFYLHPDYLDRLLKKEIGVSMKEYMLQERLRISQELLSKTDMPVTEVATYVGMNNLSYFTKVFRKYIGLNPSDFRKRG